MQTPDYVQVTGWGDFTKMNIPAGDSGGELDPHGADQLGNPHGGLVFGNSYGKYQQYHEWTVSPFLPPKLPELINSFAELHVRNRLLHSRMPRRQQPPQETLQPHLRPARLRLEHPRKLHPRCL